MTVARPRRRNAFTLLELMIALSMVAVISVSLYASLVIGFKARRAAEEAVESPRVAANVIDMLKSDLENAMPPSAIQTAAPIVGNFLATTGQGTANFRVDDLVFCAAVNGPSHAAGDGEVRQIELTVKVPDNPALGAQPALVRRVTANLLAATLPNPDEEVLCRNVLGFSLRYWDGQTWQDTWNAQQPSNGQQVNLLPLAIEVTLDFQPSAGRPGTTPHYRQVIPLSMSAPQNTNALGLGNLGF